jgi:DNA-binding CsgD family transcriptional regulator
MIQVADGCLSKQVAHGMRIATVKMHRRRAMKKTDAQVRFRS